MENGCVEGAKHGEKILALEKRADKNESEHLSFSDAIREIRDHLLGRPAWPVVFLMMGLSSLCCGLIVKMIGG